MTKDVSTSFRDLLDFLSAAPKLSTEKGLATRLLKHSPTEVYKEVTVRRKTQLHKCYQNNYAMRACLALLTLATLVNAAQMKLILYVFH